MEALQNAPALEVSRPALIPTPTSSVTAEAPAASSTSPAMPGSHAPDAATAAPTVAPMLPSPSPVVTAAPSPAPLPTLSLPSPAPLSNVDRWRAQQNDRFPYEAPRPFYTTGTELWWYDPINQQSVILGRITGDFQGQAEFILRGQGVTALEVPYQVNVSYGLTAISPALLERIRAAGYTDWIETYVFLTPAVLPR